MAKFLANGNLTIDIDDSGGTPRSMEEYVDEVTGVGKAFDILETTAYADTAPAHIMGNAQAVRVVVRGHYDDTATTGPDAVLRGIVGGSAGTLTIKPDGVRTLAGEYFCVRYDYTFASKSTVRFEAEFVPTGDVSVT